MMKKLLSVGVVGALFFGISMAVNAVDAEEAIEYRQAVMGIIAWNLRPMGAMVRGKVPFNAQTFAKRAENLVFLSQLPLEGFIPGSYEGDTSAKSEIEANWDDFKAKMAGFEAEAVKLAEVAKTATTMKKEIISQFVNTARTCKACHRKYKRK